MLAKISSSPKRILDFDMETEAAGFADPQWVPQKITCVAWSWIGEDRVYSRVCTSSGLYELPTRRTAMITALLSEILKADMVTGHNLIRFDLPVLNAEMMRLGMGSLPELIVQDTMLLPKSKGFKKGMDNISQLLDIPMEKQAMTWQQWDDAYAKQGWPEVISRCEGDVLMHKLMRAKLIEEGLLKPPRRWKP